MASQSAQCFLEREGGGAGGAGTMVQQLARVWFGETPSETGSEVNRSLRLLRIGCMRASLVISFRASILPRCALRTSVQLRLIQRHSWLGPMCCPVLISTLLWSARQNEWSLFSLLRAEHPQIYRSHFVQHLHVL